MTICNACNIFPKNLTRKPLIILGGNGIVGSALAHQLSNHPRFSKRSMLVLDPTLDERHRFILEDGSYEQLLSMLKSKPKFKDAWVIDLAPPLNKPVAARLAAQFGVNYLNTTSINGKPGLCDFLSLVDTHREIQAHGGKIILCSGANPGVVNVLAEELIERHGKPDNLISWEYDGNHRRKGSGPFITWNSEEFLEEAALPYWFEPQRQGTIQFHRTRPCDTMQPLPSIPLIPEGAKGMTIPHEECVILGWRHACASRFIYGFANKNPLLPLLRHNKPPQLPRLPQLLAPDIEGTDIVGMTWQKGTKRIRNWISCSSVPARCRTNTTGWLVAAGVVSALVAAEKVKPGCYLCEELPRKPFLQELKNHAEVFLA